MYNSRMLQSGTAAYGEEESHMTDKLTVTVPEMAKMLGISRPLAYELAKKRGFPAIRVSERRIIIPVDRLHAWLSANAGEGDNT